MAFTYTADPAAVDADAVRLMLADTNEDDPLLDDAAVAWLLAEWPTTRQAARAGAEMIAAQFTRQAAQSTRIGDVSLSFEHGARAADYRALAESLARQAARVSAPVAYAHPDALLRTGVREPGETTDFTVGMFDLDTSSEDE